jgi:hypothetical protein
MERASNEEQLPKPRYAAAIYILGLLGFFTFGILGVIAYCLGRSYKWKLAEGLVRRSKLADTGYIMGTIGFLIFLAFVAFLLLILTGVIVLIRI